jgi:hypothetical protein
MRLVMIEKDFYDLDKLVCIETRGGPEMRLHFVGLQKPVKLTEYQRQTFEHTFILGPDKGIVHLDLPYEEPPEDSDPAAETEII